MVKGIYKFYWDCGRMGFLDGIFVADSDLVKKSYGARLSFGEVLGKHSDIGGTLGEEDFTFISDDPLLVEKFEQLNIRSGHNPIDLLLENGYFEEEEED